MWIWTKWKKVYLLKKNWTHVIKKNEDNEDIKRRSRSLDNQDKDSINEWLIISFEWQTPIIIYEWHVKTGNHLKIQATLDQIMAEEYKWDRIYGDIRNFWFKCQIWSVSSGKLRKREIVHHIQSSKPLERCQIGLVQLAWELCTKPYKYLFIMVDHFSKYAWEKMYYWQKVSNCN